MKRLLWRAYDAICWQASRRAIRLANAGNAHAYWRWHFGWYELVTRHRGRVKQWVRAERQQAALADEAEQKKDEQQ